MVYSIVSLRHPKLHCRIDPPWPPSHGTLVEFTCRFQSAGALQTQIAGRKGLRLVQGAHREISRSPESDAERLVEPVE
jgi:hypothetical protein